MKSPRSRTAGLGSVETISASLLLSLALGGLLMAMSAPQQVHTQQLDQTTSRGQGMRLVQALKAKGTLVHVEQRSSDTLLQYASFEPIDGCLPPSEWPTRNVVLSAGGLVDGEQVAPLVTATQVQPGDVTVGVHVTLQDGQTAADHIPFSPVPACEQPTAPDRWAEVPTTPQTPSPTSELGTGVRFTRQPSTVRPPSEREPVEPTYYSDRDGNLISAEEWDALPPEERFKRSDRDGYSQPDPWRPGQPEPGECVGDDCRPSHWRPS